MVLDVGTDKSIFVCPNNCRLPYPRREKTVISP